MQQNLLVHSVGFQVSGTEYLIEVYIRPDGTHYAQTAFSSDDVIINDGIEMEDTLCRHQTLLPLAVSSREMVS